VFLIGIGIVVPVFFTQPQTEPIQFSKVMLCFSVHEQENVNSWCINLEKVLHEQNVPASVFFSGKIAEKNPKVLAHFGSSVDIGSQTYSYVDLTSLDFEQQIQEVAKGKQKVDRAGQINSRLFKAPYGATDENIYYLLSQSKIVADFSYDIQYNLYENGLFIKYDAIAYDGEVSNFALIDVPITTLHIIEFDSSDTILQILDTILALKEFDVTFVNASDVAGTDLTGRISS
jgi:peptidoglycan/xylan/chitin deacetylase (PgdA/CDA1 family)